MNQHVAKKTKQKKFLKSQRWNSKSYFIIILFHRPFFVSPFSHCRPNCFRPFLFSPFLFFAIFVFRPFSFAVIHFALFRFAEKMWHALSRALPSCTRSFIVVYMPISNKKSKSLTDIVVNLTFLFRPELLE